MSPPLLKPIRPPSLSADGGFSFNEILKAGIIVFRKKRSRVEILLLYRTQKNDWSFPKGHVETNEGVLEAALREVQEETGIRPMVLGRLTDLTYEDEKKQPVRLALFLGCADAPWSVTSSKSADESTKWVPLSFVERKLSYENLRRYFKNSIAPLFKRKNHSHQIQIDVVFSEEEPCANGAKRLVRRFHAAGLLSRCVELNLFNIENSKVPTKQLYYFLTNHRDAPNAALWFAHEGNYVVNREYVRFWHSKSQVQRVLRQFGIPVLPSGPLLTQGKKIKPFFLKSEHHGLRDPAVLAANSSHAPWSVYIERKLDRKKYTETKVAYVAGRVFVHERNNPLITRAVEQYVHLFHRIQECLGLEIFSADILLNPSHDFFIIDVNPAPAFFWNANARIAFGSFVRMIGKMYL